MKNIGIKKIETSIPENTFISRVEGIIGNVKNCVFEGVFTGMHVYELEKGILALFDFYDSTGSISVLIVGNRDEDFKSFLESLIMRHTYRIQGNVHLVE